MCSTAHVEGSRVEVTPSSNRSLYGFYSCKQQKKYYSNCLTMVTGIADAGMDSVPVVAITGQVPTGVIATDAFQESDVVGVMMPLTKQAYMPLSIGEIERTIHEAMCLASNGRGGPVIVDIPKDVQIQETDDSCEFDPQGCEPDLPGFNYSCGDRSI
jgi:acetolactate synthase-1/2/3 large subunit